MTDAIESPAALRQKAEKCERIAKAMPNEGDAATLFAMAEDYREMAARLERRAGREELAIDAQRCPDAPGVLRRRARARHDGSAPR